MTLPARDKPKSKQWLKMAVEYGERRDLPGDRWWWGGALDRVSHWTASHWYWILLDTSGTFKIPMDGIPVTAAAGGMATQLHHSPARGAENNPSYDIIWGLLVRSAVYDEPQTHHPLVTTHVMSCPRSPPGTIWGKYYNYRVTAYHPLTGRIECMESPDPCLDSLRNDQERDHWFSWLWHAMIHGCQHEWKIMEMLEVLEATVTPKKDHHTLSVLDGTRENWLLTIWFN